MPEGLIWPNIDSDTTLIDYKVKLENGEFELWKNNVP